MMFYPNFDDLFITNHYYAIANHHHKFLRTQLCKLIAASFLTSQCGGMPMLATDFAHDDLQMYIHTMQRVGRSWSILFVDASQAFYSMARMWGARGVSFKTKVNMYKSAYILYLPR